MERLEPLQLKIAILQALGWARVGITDPTERMRDKAAVELALAICAQINPAPVCARDQLALPF